MPQCDSCGKWAFCYTRHVGGYFGREVHLCFHCLSVHDQEKIRRDWDAQDRKERKRD